MKFKKIIYAILLITIIVLIILVLVNSLKINGEKNKNVSSSNNVNTNSNGNVTEKKENKDTSIIQITESYFMTTINDIYINYKDYEGKEVEYEGFVYFPQKDGYSMVVGRNYNCCGYDAFVIGFECKTDKKLTENTWVKVRGKIAINNSNSSDIYPYLEVSSIEEKQERGAETVYN